jgi:hypothetical protein
MIADLSDGRWIPGILDLIDDELEYRLLPVCQCRFGHDFYLLGEDEL